MIHIKICGLKREEDINYANELEIDYAGFVFAKSKRQINKNDAYKYKQMLSKNIKSVGVFVNNSLEEIENIIEEGIIDIVQLHGNENNEIIEKIQNKYNLPVIKSVSITGSDSINEYVNSSANYLLLDNKNAGSGQKFKWEYFKQPNKPFFVAGGLQVENVIDCINKFYPYGVDVSSGVEIDGFKNFEKMKEFVRRVKEHGK